MTLPDGAEFLGSWACRSASVMACDIGGVFWLYGLESTGDGDAVRTVLTDAENYAKYRGYGSVFTESSVSRVAKVAHRFGYQARAVIMEKQL